MKAIETVRSHEGFSLIELLIVVAIIGILAAIAIPSLIAARRAANEASAQSSLRTISNCQATYRATNGNKDYGFFNDLKIQYLTDSVLASGTKSGYFFTVNPTVGLENAQFHLTAVPTSTNGVSKTGTRRFGMTEDGVIRGDTNLTLPADHAAVQAMPPVL